MRSAIDLIPVISLWKAGLRLTLTPTVKRMERIVYHITFLPFRKVGFVRSRVGQTLNTHSAIGVGDGLADVVYEWRQKKKDP